MNDINKNSQIGNFNRNKIHYQFILFQRIIRKINCAVEKKTILPN